MGDEIFQEPESQPPPSIEIISPAVRGKNKTGPTDSIIKPPALPPSPLAGSKPHVLPALGFKQKNHFLASEFAIVDLGNCDPGDQNDQTCQLPPKEGSFCDPGVMLQNAVKMC